MHSRSFLAQLSFVLSLALGVTAQKPAAQCLPGWEWNRNSLSQDPCMIGMTLDASCRGELNYTWTKLEKTQYYLPLNKSRNDDIMDCDCNTVMYSLIMACATCQQGIAYAWSKWAVACGGTYYITQLPYNVPQGTAIPRWAFYNVTTLKNETYDEGVAKNVGRDPEEMPKSQSTISRPTSTGGMGNRNPSGGSNTVAIVGGVVGGAGALIIVPIVAYFVFRRIRKNRDKSLQPQYQETPINLWKKPPGSPTYQPSLYNPEDPRTFPPPMSMGQTHRARPSVTFVTPLRSNYGARR